MRRDVGLYEEFAPDAERAAVPRVVPMTTPRDQRRNGAAEPLRVMFWEEAGVVTAPDALVRRLMGTTALALVYGASGSGKTFLAADLALHVALGWEWFGRKTLAGPVLYVAAEGFAGLSNRLVAFRMAHEIKTEIPFAVVPVAVDLGPGGRDAPRVIAAADAVSAKYAQPVRLVVIDTLARAIGGGDENTAQDMGAFIAACDRIKVETGATVLIVHHTGKAQGAGARGSTALVAAVDTALEIERNDAGRVAKVVKQKDGADGEQFGFSLDGVEIGRDDEDEPVTSCVVTPAAAASNPASRRAPTGKAGVVFNALRRAVHEGGTDAPASAHIPAGCRVASINLWRDFAYQMMGEASPDARQKAFVRARDSLSSAGHVAIWGDHAWTP